MYRSYFKAIFKDTVSIVWVWLKRPSFHTQPPGMSTVSEMEQLLSTVYWGVLSPYNLVPY